MDSKKAVFKTKRLTEEEKLARRVADHAAITGELPAGYHKEAGYLVGPNGRPVAPGVVCRCHEGVTVCPMHGRR